tara:strand:+ start:323 stop:475 length:153 start_codon:yes stop_codon:yes gene_type:complete
MNKKLTTKAEWAKHLRRWGKRIANKKHRKDNKNLFKELIDVKEKKGDQVS